MSSAQSGPRSSQRLECVENVGDIEQTPSEVRFGPKRKLEEMTPKSELVETRSSKALQTYIESEDHWFCDGNVLFQIGNTRFKIHRSRIASESPWFQALFDQRAGNHSEEPYDYRGEIDTCLESAEQDGGLDLFYLDFRGGPNSTQFGRLLTAMQSAIDYAFGLPPFDVIVDIYTAANFFELHKYEMFGQEYLERTFPDNWGSVRDFPLNISAKALILGRRYDNNLSAILRHCYYDLARTHPLPISIPEDDAEKRQQGPSPGDLKNATSHTFFCLLNIQRNLNTAWDRVHNLLDYDCSNTACNVQHKGTPTFKNVKDRYPFDPITGIKVIPNDPIFIDNYCPAANLEVQRRLQMELDNIWAGLKSWANIQ